MKNDKTKKIAAIEKQSFNKELTSLSLFAIVTGTKYLKVVIEDKIVKYAKKVVKTPNCSDEYNLVIRGNDTIPIALAITFPLATTSI